MPRSHPDGIDINARCLDGDRLADLEIAVFDDDDREAETAALAHLTNGSS